MKKIFNKILNIDFWLETCWLAIVFITPIIFAWWSGSANMFELTKGVFFCVATEILAILFLLKIFLENKINFKLDFKLIAPLIFWVGAVFLSLIWAVDVKESFWGSFERQQGIWFILHLLAFFFILFFSIKNFRQIKRILLTFVFSTFIICLYGLIQFFGWDWWSWAETASGSNRIFSTLGQPNFFAHFLIITIPISIYSLFFIAKKNIYKFLIALLILGEVFSLTASLSRAAWLGFIAQITILIVIWALVFKNKYKKVKIGLVLTLILIFISSFFFISNSDNALGNRLKSTLNFESGSVKMRIFYWSSAWEEIKTMNIGELMFGYGPENTDNVFVKYYDKDWGIYEEVDSFPDRAHNVFFDLFFNYGLVGFFLFACFWFLIFANLIKYAFLNKERPEYFWLAMAIIVIFSGYFINVLFSFSVVSTLVYLFVLAAISIFLLSKKNSKITLSLNFFSRISKIAIFVFFVVFLAIMIWLFNIRPIIADYYYGQVVAEASTEAKCLPIMRDLNKVIYYQPGVDYYQRKYIHYHLNCLKNKNLTAVNSKIKENINQVFNMIDKPILDYRLNFKIAHAYSLFGYYFDESYYKEGEDAYQNLLEINPDFLGIYSDYGRMKLWQQEYMEAIKILEKGLANAPDLNNPHINNEHLQDINNKIFVFYDTLAQSYFYQGKYKKAEDYFQKALKINPFDADIYKGLGDCYYMQNDLERAIKYYEKSLSLNPSNYELSEFLPLIYNELKN